MVKRIQKKMTKAGVVQKLIAENKKLRMEKKAIKERLEKDVRKWAKEREERDAEKEANNKEMSNLSRFKDALVKTCEEVFEKYQSMKASKTALKEKLAREEMEHKNELQSMMETIEYFLNSNEHIFNQTHLTLQDIQNTSQKGAEAAQLFVASQDSGDTEACSNALGKFIEIMKEFGSIEKSARDTEKLLVDDSLRQKQDDKERREHNTDTLPSTPVCQICAFEFSDSPGGIPRLLRCGHTLCERCAHQIHQGSIIKCPFDRKETRVVPGRCSYLPKNFTVMEVIEQRIKPMEE